MASLVYSRKARSDLAEIWLQIAASGGERLADDILDRLSTRASMLGSHPELGPARTDISPQARSLVCERWLILYRVDANLVHIIRIVDGARDLRRIAVEE